MTEPRPRPALRISAEREPGAVVISVRGQGLAGSVRARLGETGGLAALLLLAASPGIEPGSEFETTLQAEVIE